MEMDKYWHPKMTWYGPCGIGTGRGMDWLPKLASDPVSEWYARQGTIC